MSLAPSFSSGTQLFLVFPSPFSYFSIFTHFWHGWLTMSAIKPATAGGRDKEPSGSVNS